MRINPRFVALLVAAGSLLAQTQPPAADKPATVEGTVSVASTGAPVPRAHVTLRSTGQTSDGNPHQFGAMSTADGKFSIAGILPGTYNVFVEKTGFAFPQAVSGRIAWRLQADEKKTDAKLTLVPSGSITGRVTDPRGEPIEQANVTAEGVGASQTTLTDDKGEYRIGGLMPGRFRLYALPRMRMPMPPEIRTDGTAEVHYAFTWYPGSLTAKAAAPVEVRPGIDTGGVNIQLTVAPFVKVAGTVSGLRESDTRGSVVARRPGIQNTSSGVLRPDGTFEIWGLDPGRYELFAFVNSASGRTIQTPAVSVEVAGSNIDSVELRVVPDFPLSGQVRFEDENASGKWRPPANNSQTTNGQKSPSSAPSAHVLMFQEAGLMPGAAASAKVDDSDNFRVETVQARKYRVTSVIPSLYVKSMMLGGTAIDGALVDLTNGTGGADLTVLLSAAVGAVSGTVQDSAGNVQGTRVVLAAEDPDDNSIRPRFQSAKADGSFTFANVPPGRYRIVAVREADTDSVAQPSVLAQYADVMEPIEVHPGDTLTKDLKRRSPEDR